MKIRNYVAKHSRTFNRAAVFKDKRRAAKLVRGQKHKGKTR